MQRFHRAGYALAGALLAGTLLWLLFRHADWPRLLAELRGARPGWLALGVLNLLIANAIRGVRCWPGLQTCARVSVRATVSSAMIAQFANMALPIRGGPILRGLALARLSPLPLSNAIGASFADRAVEGAVLAAGLLILSAGITFSGWLPPGVATTTAATTMAVLGSLILFIGAMLAGAASGRQHRWLEARLSRRLPKGAAAWGEFAAGVRSLMLSRGAMPVWFGCIASWFFLIIANTCALKALGIPTPPILPVLTCFMATITVVLPGTPGLMGPFHAAIVGAMGLALPGASNETALAAALVIHALYAVTIAILGTMALLTEHESLWRLEAAESALESDKDPMP